MKGRCFFTVLALLFGLSSLAQDIDISKEQYLRSDHDYEIIGKIGDRVMMLKLESDKKKFQAYDERMRQIWDKEIKLERRSAKVIGVVPGNEDFTLIYSFKRKGRLKVMARKFDNKLKLLDSTIVHLRSQL